MGGRVISLIDYRGLRLARNGQTAREPSLGVRLKKPHPRPPKARQRLLGSYVDSIDRVEMSLTFPRTKVSPKWWDSGFIVPVLALLCCVAVVAIVL